MQGNLKYLTSVWKSDEKVLIFASLISPFKILLFEKLYQAFDTVSSKDEWMDSTVSSKGYKCWMLLDVLKKLFTF